MKNFALTLLAFVVFTAIADARPRTKDEPPPDCYPKECLAVR